MGHWKLLTRCALLAAFALVGTATWLLPAADAGTPMSTSEWIVTAAAGTSEAAQHCASDEDCVELCEVWHTTPQRIVPTGYFDCQ